MTCISYYSIIQNSSIVLKMLCVLSPHPSLSANSGNLWSFCCLHSYPFIIMSCTVGPWTHGLELCESTYAWIFFQYSILQYHVHLVCASQAGIKISGRNTNLRYADNATLMAKSKAGLKSFLMKVEEKSEKAGLKLNIQRLKVMASGAFTSWQIHGETVVDIIFLVSKITADGDHIYDVKRRLLLG